MAKGKNKGKFVSYLRVSTARQGESGLGEEAQRAAVAQYLNGGEWTLVEEVKEEESGKRSDNRPALAHALQLCRAYGATLIIAKLDRLARNVHFISGLMESRIEFVAVDMPYANKLTVHIIAAMAEHEAEMISQRTKAALAALKARGVKLGGLRGDPSRMAAISKQGKPASIATRQADAAERRSDHLVAIRSVQASGAKSYREIASVLNKRGVQTARGGPWTGAHVFHVLKAKQTITTEPA